MARIYGENGARAETTKIAGTYAEIISGKRNISFFEADHSLNLLGYAWMLWKEGRSIEFLDVTLLADSCAASEAEKYVWLGLLCVQERAADRPDMPGFVAMAANDIAALPLPKQPAYLANRTSLVYELLLSIRSHRSSNFNRRMCLW